MPETVSDDGIIADSTTTGTTTSNTSVTNTSNTETKTAKWAIAKEDGTDALTISSFLSCDIRNDSQVVSGNVEEGSFAAYNKVFQPVEISVSVGIQGTDSELQEALNKIDSLKNGLELVSIVTPNSEYKNMNCVSYSYSRKRENGLGALWVDLEFQEIRQVKATYTNVRLAKRQNTGVKQTEQSIIDSIGEGISKRLTG